MYFGYLKLDLILTFFWTVVIKYVLNYNKPPDIFVKLMLI